MTFKQTVEADIKNVFINFDEFATQHNINGKVIQAVEDDDLTTERAARGGTGTDEFGNIGSIYFGARLLFVAKDDLGYRPVTGNSIRLDGDIYAVVNVVESMGLYEITLRAIQQR